MFKEIANQPAVNSYMLENPFPGAPIVEAFTWKRDADVKGRMSQRQRKRKNTGAQGGVRALSN